MSVKMSQKPEIIKEHRISEQDTGSSQVQVAVLTQRIKQLTEHLKVHKKDNHTRLGLMKMINRRRGLLDYLKKKQRDSYLALIEKLGLRS